MRASDTLLVRIVQPADGAALGGAGRVVEIHARDLRDADVRCTRAEWSDEGLRQLEAARQFSVPSAACPLACPELVAGDRIAWTEATGRNEEVRTVEAVVVTRTEISVIVDRHPAALRDLADPFPLGLQARDHNPRPGRRVLLRHHVLSRHDWTARCMKAIAPNRPA